MLNKLIPITKGLNRRFTDGDNPFQIATRLLEECGELAKEINQFEGCGVKREKYGELHPRVGTPRGRPAYP